SFLCRPACSSASICSGVGGAQSGYGGGGGAYSSGGGGGGGGGVGGSGGAPRAGEGSGQRKAQRSGRRAEGGNRIHRHTSQHAALLPFQSRIARACCNPVDGRIKSASSVTTDATVGAANSF